jgi:hypothetical protein
VSRHIADSPSVVRHRLRPAHCPSCPTACWHR